MEYVLNNKKELKYKELSHGVLFLNGRNVYLKTNLCGTAVNIKTGIVGSFTDDESVFLLKQKNSIEIDVI